MRKKLFVPNARAFASVAVLLCIGCLMPGQQFEWQKATPESQSMSSRKLEALRDNLARRGTQAFLVIRNDKIVYEWYAKGFWARKKHGSASLAKAIVGGLSLAVAISDNLISLDDPAKKYIPEWNGDQKKARITVRHLGSHTSGLDDSQPQEEAKWKEDFWKQLEPPNDPFTIARDKTPVLFKPGEKFRYSNPAFGLLSYCVTKSMKETKHRDIRTQLKERVMKPIGVSGAEWSIGYGRTFTVSGLPLVASWGGGSFTPRTAARIGRLILREGNWDGRLILSRKAVRQITHDAKFPGNCGMGWWTNGSRRYDWLPEDAVWGAGAGDQVLLVVPSLKLIMVRNGSDLLTPEERKKLNPKNMFEKYHDPRAEILFKPLVEAMTDRSTSDSPNLPSPVISGIEWQPKDSIIRKAKGSDNWPLTWAEDGHMYTAYGDGRGFEPFIPEKLGLGIARVEGGPNNFTGFNIRSGTAENFGQGKHGKKASGMLMIDGILYMLARNAGNAQLAWSKDHGRTWKWADWKFTTSFGYPTFLNFGRNYAGARDEFVYVYSHDADSAYQTADQMVLARVPKENLTEREAYEFFKGLDTKGRPMWTSTVAERGAVFTHKGRCYRSAITYNAGLKRYLWVQIFPGTEGEKADTRFEGGFGIYDAPEPWGPWTTVFFTEKWDVGPGETASFPTKWISPDGKTLHMVFSGDDHFAVRKAVLTVSEIK
jgi:CubicO group peptidase (beta-lactamase class C family)